MINRAVTLNNIVDKLDVYNFSVSIALKGNSGISPKATKLANQITDELTYKPIFKTERLAKRKSKLINNCVLSLEPGEIDGKICISIVNTRSTYRFNASAA